MVTALKAAGSWIIDPDHLTAVSTGVIALFTIALTVVGWRQARLIGKSVDLARDEFNATHRPRLIVRDVRYSGTNIDYLLVNSGDAPATVVESWVLMEFVPDDKILMPVRPEGHDDLGRMKIAVGEAKPITYRVPADAGFNIRFPNASKTGVEEKPPWPPGSFYFTGTIVYADAGGRLRRTVFRREFNERIGGFERLGPDQEYSD